MNISRTRPDSRVAVAAMACLTAVILYSPSIRVLPFSDDWQMSAWAEQHGRDIFFSGANFRLSTRLLFALAHPLLQERVGLIIIPLSIAALVLTAWLLTTIARRFAGESPWAPVCVAILYLFHPANASAVIQVDTIGQVLADLMIVVCVRQMVFRDNPHGPASAALATALTLLTLLNKETGLGLLAWIPAAACLRTRYVQGLGWPATLRNGLALCVAVAIGIAMLFLIRTLADTPLTPSTSGRYSVHLDPALVALNALQLLGAALYFGDVATLYVYGLSTKAVIGSVVSILLLGVALRGFAPMRSNLKPAPEATGVRDLYLWASFIPPSLLPMILMGSVSDLYVAGITPFVALLLGVACTRTFTPGAPLFAVLGLIALWGGASVLDKQFLRQRASERTWAHVQALSELLPHCDFPRRGIVIEGNLADTTTGARQYSSFSVTNERILRSVLAAYADPYRRVWVYDGRASPTGSAPSNTPQCSVVTEQSTKEKCLLRCSTAPTEPSRIIRCEPLRELCADTRI